MSEVAVHVRGVSKRYHIGAVQTKYRTLRDNLADALVAPFRRARSLLRGHATGAADLHESIWALRDVNFEVRTGEVVGLIGRNGAGKSTLLKILSRITEPTEGFVAVHGRVGSLLEVGTGFHPELTGRENVYLNGAILGMRRAEIDRKFDEIVAFAETEKFIDTPVKHYSDGMRVRLAFAVAAHLEPEILVVDEVLSVGDAAFQRKCLGKMGEVATQGRTILFVSHNMPSVTRLCERAILLDGGTVVEDGPSHRVVAHYLSSGLGIAAAREWNDLTTAPGNGVVRLRAVRVLDHSGQTSDSIDIRRPMRIEVEYQVLKPGQVLLPNLTFENEEGVCAFATWGHDTEWRRRPRPPGRYVSSVSIPGNYLAEGTLIVNAAIVTQAPFIVHSEEKNAVSFHVVDTIEGDSARGDYGKHMPGVVRPFLEWDDRAVGDRHQRALAAHLDDAGQ